MLTGIPTRWQQPAKNLPVAQKKEIFYRFMLPLIMHANSMVLDRRSRLASMREKATAGGEQSTDDLIWLHQAAVLLRIIENDSGLLADAGSPELLRVIDEAFYKLDIVPAGLALGQAAYESGYGTSRFNEPIRFIVPANSESEALSMEERIEAARESGEITKIVARMRLE